MASISRIWPPIRRTHPFGERSTAGKLFGATGGVMEAAIRTAHFLLTGKELQRLRYMRTCGTEGCQGSGGEHCARKEIRVAVVTDWPMREICWNKCGPGEEEPSLYRSDDVSGGCIAGGGQPLGADLDAVRARMQALYKIDRSEPVRTSHANKSIQRLYDEYLEKPLSHKSHDLLHTHYAKREVVI
jgi:iron only hydrogenase large subunit-like protein